MIAVWATLLIILIFVNIGVAYYCAAVEETFGHLDYIWRFTRGELNLAGRIICVTLAAIVTAPAIVLMIIVQGFLFIVCGICTVFCWVFRDRSKKK